MSSGVLVETLQQLKQLPEHKLVEVLRNESGRHEITRSLLNILFNVCFTRSIHLNPHQQQLFRPFDRVVLELLSRPRSKVSGHYLVPDVPAKRRLLLKHPGLVKLLIQVCPTPGQFRQLLLTEDGGPKVA